MRKKQIPLSGEGLLANLRYRKKWKRLTTILSVFVVIGTLSALVLPAVTMNLYICGQEEHTHQDACYTVTAENVLTCTAHLHGPACYDAQGGLLCTQETHQHTDACYTQQQTKSLHCQLPEHTHTDACRALIGLSKQEWQQVEDVASIIEGLPPVEQIEARLSELVSDPAALAAYREKILGAIRTAFDEYGKLSEAQQSVVPNGADLERYRYLLYKEETLEVTCDGYRLTVHCPAQAQIPADAVVEMTPVSDSAEYLAQAAAALTDYRILDGRFFDITIYSQGQKVQPAADVELTVTFETPMAVQPGDHVQLLHFGAEGVEVLEGHVDRDNTYVYTASFRQGSFSVSGAVATQPMVVNDTDKGRDSVMVNYYVHLNGSWQQVGTTTTGWYNAYNGSTNGTSEGQSNGDYVRDYVTEAQVASIFGPYGFKCEGNSARTIAYEYMDHSTNTHVWSDTHTDVVDGVRIIPLSQGARNYNLYFIPNNTVDSAATSRDNMFNVFSGEYRFYSIDVFDPQRLAFQTDAECQAQQVIFLTGSSPTITLPKLPDGWRFVHDGDQLNNDLKFTENSDGTVSCQVQNLTQHLRVMPEASTAYGPDNLVVTYMVYLDGGWHVVGRTEQGWYGHYTDPSVWANDASRDHINAKQIEEILGPYGFDAATAYEHPLAYQQQGQDHCFRDTTFYSADGQRYFCLSRNNGSGYLLYYVPGNGNTPYDGCDPTALPLDGSHFYSITVRDDVHWVYSAEELAQVNGLRAYKLGTNGDWRYFASAARETETGKVEVERAGWTWVFFYTDTAGNLAYDDSVLNFTFEDPDPNDGLVTYTRANMNRPLILDAGKSSWSDSTAGPQTGDLQTVKGNGITFKLFDYRADINDLLKQKGLMCTPMSSDTAGVAQNYFFFRHSGRYCNSNSINNTYDKDGYHHYEDGRPDHTTVKRNLANGYPLFDFTHKGYLSPAPAVDGTSMDFLFSGNAYVRQYDCTNTPLWFNESDGYYVYSSVSNAADYDTASNTWYVRGYLERGQKTAEKYLGYADFFPFNNGDGTIIGTSGGKAQTYHYKTDDVDYWFGVSMNVEFFQGKNGQMEHNGKTQDMEFYFSGDDDVWVFIDNMLVLDIGGTHGAVDGTINLSTGLVTAFYNFDNSAGGTGDHRYASTSLYECYEAALKETGLSDAEVQARLKEIFVATGKTATDKWGKEYPVYRFKDYSSHNMKFFYMERGSDASNCTIKFNLPTLPDETLFVGKELEFDDSTLTEEQIDFAKENLTYRFRVVDANDQPIFSSRTVDVYDETLQKVIGTTTVDENGWFTLKAGQRVKFEHMLKTLQDLDKPLEYYVQEAIPSDLVGQYNGVVYKDAGTSGDVTIDGVEGHDWVIYKTNALSPENTYTVIYTNKVDVEKMSFLQIRKNVLSGSVYTGQETFPVVVSLGGKPVPVGTQFHYTDGNKEIVTAGEGGIVQLQVGRTLQLSTPIIAGTAFEVKENSIDGWSLVGYTASHGTAKQDSVSGEIPVGATVTVTITNRTNAFGVSVPITKVFHGGPANITRTATFRMEQVTDKTGATVATSKYPTKIQDITISCIGSTLTSGEFHLNYDADTPSGTYYYRITEAGYNADPSEMFIKDETVYVVEVQVENAAAKVTALYVDGKKQTETVPAFVNPFAVVELPETGGAGTQLYTFSGLAMIAVACALMYNTKRKQRRGAK